MIPVSFDYAAPKTLREALGLMAAGAKPLAGGMSLIPMMKLRLAAPESLVDIGRLEELSYVREQGGAIHVGASTTHYDVQSSPLLLGKCPLLSETAGHIGDIQVRNMGTIGGSVAHADPAADYPAALQALEASIVLKSSSSERTVSAADFFVDAFTTALEPGEIVSEIIVPVDGESIGTSYRKCVHPASGFAVVGIAARLRRVGGKIDFARIGVTGFAGHSYRALKAEQALVGKAGADADVRAAAALLADGVEANSDLFASPAYRAQLLAAYAARAFAAAIKRSA
jgi:carbon-monoxide dehydrogenase medium subunit